MCNVKPFKNVETFIIPLIKIFFALLYFAFIRPILKYGGVVWDNCSLENYNLFRKYISRSSKDTCNNWSSEKIFLKKTLYQELGLDLLNTIRDQQKFLVFDIYKAHRLQYLPPIFRIYFYPSIPQHMVTTSETMTSLIFQCHNREQFHL